jgi:hypothetical protein
MQLFEHLQYADVRATLCAAAGEDESDAGTCRILCIRGLAQAGQDDEQADAYRDESDDWSGMRHGRIL